MRWMQQAAAAASASSMIGVGALAVWGPFVLSRSWRGTGWEGALQRTLMGTRGSTGRQGLEGG